MHGLGLRLSALGGDLGGTRFDDGAALERRLDKTRRIIELAAELNVPIVTTHLGRVDEAALERGHVAQAVRELAEMADRTGTRVAIETAGADPVVLGKLLGEVNAPVLGAAYDPAALLIDGFAPMAGVAPLADHILNARIRDAVAGTGRRPVARWPSVTADRFCRVPGDARSGRLSRHGVYPPHGRGTPARRSGRGQAAHRKPGATLGS